MYVDNTLNVIGPLADVEELVAALEADQSVFAIAEPMGLSKQLNGGEFTNPEWPDMPGATRTVEKRDGDAKATWSFQTDMSPLKGLTSWVSKNHPTLKATHRYDATMEHVWGVYHLGPDGPHPDHHSEHHAGCLVSFWDPDEQSVEQLDDDSRGDVLIGRNLEIATHLPEHDTRVLELLDLGYELTLTEAETGEFPFRTALKLTTEVVMERNLREGSLAAVSEVLANVYAWDDSAFEALRASLLRDGAVESMDPAAQQACLATLAAMWTNTDLEPAIAWAAGVQRRGIPVRNLMPVLGMAERPFLADDPADDDSDDVPSETDEDRYAVIDGLLLT